MRFSLQHLGWFVAWAAVVSGLVCQILIEVSRDQWSSGVPSEIVWILNLSFVAVVSLTAVSDRSPRRLFWIGTAVVAIPLLMLQILDYKPAIISRNVSIALFYLLRPELFDQLMVAKKESHLMQMASVLVYSLTPILSFMAGGYVMHIYRRSSIDQGLPEK